MVGVLGPFGSRRLPIDKGAPVSGVPHNLRADDYGQPEAANDTIVVDVNGDVEGVSEKDKVLEVELPDGSIKVYLGNRTDDDPLDSTKHNENLALKLDQSALGMLADELLTDIDADEMSRAEWQERAAELIVLLGLRVDKDRNDSDTGVEGMSSVRHPLLLEACIRFQANARSELLPSDGPVKIRNDETVGNQPAPIGHNGGPPLENDQGDEMTLADALEKDMNHYLTVVATEYYPDTDRMLFNVGLIGDGFKKIYHCPVRRRPVSESVPATDLIVSNNATDLSNASRITHRIKMRKSMIKRMQLVGQYRDVALGDPGYLDQTPTERERDDQQGITATQPLRPEQADRLIYESLCEIIVPGDEHKEKGKATGLASPYKVTIDKASREILDIRRNWRENDDLRMPKRMYVQFPYIPALGFYSIGLGMILGNTTNALTAAWREMLDAGMFASFPGFLMSKAAARQNTNHFRVPPGAGVPIETGGMPIQEAVMPLPYKEPSAALMTLIQEVEQTGQRLGGTAEINVGEGRQDAPVGTTIALIEQATKPLDAVHKRLHAAQSEEFQILKDLFAEDPEAFWRFNKKPATQWDRDTLLKALQDNDVVPAADPNTSSHVMRVMKATAVKQIAQMAQPGTYDMKEVDSWIFRTLGVKDYDAFFMSPAEQAHLAQLMGQAKGGDKGAAANDPSKMAAVQQKAQSDQADQAIQAQELQLDAARLQLEKQRTDGDVQREQQEQQLDAARLQMDGAGKAAEQQRTQAELAAQEAENQRSHAREMAKIQQAATGEQNQHMLGVAGLHADMQKAAADNQTDLHKTVMDNQTSLTTNAHDNLTAEDIVDKEIEAGKHDKPPAPGNISDGKGLNKSPKGKSKG